MPSRSRSRFRSPRERVPPPARLRCPISRQRINMNRRDDPRRRRAPTLRTTHRRCCVCHRPQRILGNEPPRPHTQQRLSLELLARRGRQAARLLDAAAASPSALVGCVSSTHAPRHRMPRHRIRLGTLHLANRSFSPLSEVRPTAATNGAGAHAAAMRSAAFVKGRPRGLRCTPPLRMARLALPFQRMAR